MPRVRKGAEPRSYNAWCAMRYRCTNSNHPKFHNWGGRGIKVCARWDSYDHFAADMGPHPGKGWSLDRWPDNDGDYRPGNCRWTTTKPQARGRRTTILTEHAVADIQKRYMRGHRGLQGNARELAKEFGVSVNTIYQFTGRTQYKWR